MRRTFYTPRVCSLQEAKAKGDVPAERGNVKELGVKRMYNQVRDSAYHLDPICTPVPVCAWPPIVLRHHARLFYYYQPFQA